MENLPNLWLNLTFINLDFQESDFLRTEHIHFFLTWVGGQWRLAFLSVQAKDQVQAGQAWTKVLYLQGKSEFLLGASLPFQVALTKIGLWSSLFSVLCWHDMLMLKDISRPGKNNVSEHFPKPVTSPDSSGKGSVWCLLRSQKQPFPQLEPDSTFLSCGIGSG